MGNPVVRVDIPKNPEEEIALAQKVIAKHTEMGDNSPLNMMQMHTWDETGSKVPIALKHHEDAENFKHQSITAYGYRDNILKEITESLRYTRDILLTVYRDNPRALNEWGFDVYDSSTKQKTTAVVEK